MEKMTIYSLTKTSKTNLVILFLLSLTPLSFLAYSFLGTLPCPHIHCDKVSSSKFQDYGYVFQGKVQACKKQ